MLNLEKSYTKQTYKMIKSNDKECLCCACTTKKKEKKKQKETNRNEENERIKRINIEEKENNSHVNFWVVGTFLSLCNLLIL